MTILTELLRAETTAARKQRVYGGPFSALEAAVGQGLRVAMAASDLPLTHHHSPMLALTQTLERLGSPLTGGDLDDLAPPTRLALDNARIVLERAANQGVSPIAVYPSAEGGIYVAFDTAAGHRANIECFNDGTAYAATVADEIAVWPVSIVDQSDLDDALRRIREHLASVA